MALSLSRFVGQKVVIGDPAKPLGTVLVRSVNEGKVRLSFDFGRDTPIHRQEVADSINAGHKPRTPPT